jgi:hypothetical protein
MVFSCQGADKKELNASEVIKLMKSGKDVQLVDRIIMDDLDFTAGGETCALNANLLQCETNSNVFFSDCIFIGKVTSNGKKGQSVVQSRFNKNLIFLNCDFRGEVDFSQSIVFGLVNFSRSVFRENAAFNNMAVWSKDSYFSEMKAEKTFSMIYASFLGNLYFMDAKFNQNATFQETSVKGKLSFNNAAFNGRAGFDLMEVCGSAFFNYVVFEKNANFSFSRFLHTTDFIKTKFQEKGNLEMVYFLNTVRFEEVDMENSLILTDTFFGNKFINK